MPDAQPWMTNLLLSQIANPLLMHACSPLWHGESWESVLNFSLGTDHRSVRGNKRCERWHVLESCRSLTVFLNESDTRGGQRRNG